MLAYCALLAVVHVLAALYLLLSPGTENSAAAVHLGRDVSNILASKDRPHVAKVLYGITISALLAHVVKSAALVVGQSCDFCR
jgi:hypothetical protein